MSTKTSEELRALTSKAARDAYSNSMRVVNEVVLDIQARSKGRSGSSNMELSLARDAVIGELENLRKTLPGVWEGLQE